MNEFTPPSVSIDGESIRRIREEGKLTQLYVAKVVGVTTDTVSRWENNRYPTIRRDNALKLAEALEVDLESILRQEELHPESQDSGESPAGTSISGQRYWYLGIIVVISLVVAFMVLNSSQAPLKLLIGHRNVPNFTAPGARVPIEIEITSEKKLKGLIVREEFPPGWNLLEADPPPASLDNLTGNVRWILRDPAQNKKIVYILQPPIDIPMNTQIIIKGEIVANPDGQQFHFPVPEADLLTIAPLHWADKNGNSIIDDMEILDVSDMVDASDQIHYDWDLMEKLWDAGGYVFDLDSHQFLPVRPDLPLTAE